MEQMSVYESVCVCVCVCAVCVYVCVCVCVCEQVVVGARGYNCVVSEGVCVVGTVAKATCTAEEGDTHKPEQMQTTQPPALQ